MGEAITLRRGGGEATYLRSETDLAMAPLRGAVSADSLPPGLEAVPARRSGRLGDLEVFSLERPEADGIRDLAGRHVETRPIYNTSDDGVPFLPTGTLSLRFAEDVSEAEGRQLLSDHGLTLRKSDGDGYMTVWTPGDAVMLCAVLQQNQAVAVAEPDFRTPLTRHAGPLAADTRLDDHWHLRNTGFHRGYSFGFEAGADARVRDAWEMLDLETLSIPTIGVVDDGFDLEHPDLAGKAVEPWCFETNSADVSPRARGGGAGDWHGTGCAGLAAGSFGGGEIVGVAPWAKLMPIRMGAEFDDLMLERIFRYLAAKGCWVVNCSWGPTARVYELSDRAHRAIADCVRGGRNGLGTPVIFAAGNAGSAVSDDERHNGLAAHPDVIAVSAITSLDRFADYSCFGKEIAVCAPSDGSGWGMTTADVRDDEANGAGTSVRGYARGDYFQRYGGTSGAAALVSGVCALIQSVAPALSADQLRALLLSTAREVGPRDDYDSTGHSLHFGHGCVDAAAAVAEARRLNDVGRMPVG